MSRCPPYMRHTSTASWSQLVLLILRSIMMLADSNAVCGRHVSAESTLLSLNLEALSVQCSFALLGTRSARLAYVSKQKGKGHLTIASPSSRSQDL